MDVQSVRKTILVLLSVIILVFFMFLATVWVMYKTTFEGLVGTVPDVPSVHAEKG
ncbi:hypothetical protein [Staphylospora marina]|uniref:hypothetical protein n=1 Tax=Staphylospora marina TaxID=2490858 RepID=UPI0013DDFF9C|nr:hypothetical protein [Staphylospora marina]